jgi:hypothetical protein
LAPWWPSRLRSHAAHTAFITPGTLRRSERSDRIGLEDADAEREHAPPQRYIEAAEQERLAENAMARLVEKGA